MRDSDLRDLERAATADPPRTPEEAIAFERPFLRAGVPVPELPIVAVRSEFLSGFAGAILRLERRLLTPAWRVVLSNEDLVPLVPMITVEVVASDACGTALMLLETAAYSYARQREYLDLSLASARSLFEVERLTRLLGSPPDVGAP